MKFFQSFVASLLLVITVPAVDSVAADDGRPPAPQPDLTSVPLDSVNLNPPSNDKLVSILKRKLPPTNADIVMHDAPPWFQNMMQSIVRDNVPSKYVQEKDWGKTSKRWDGLKVQRRGLKLSTKRRWKEVNHGTWKRYEISQMDPEQHLRLRIENVHDAGDGKIGFEVALAAKLHVHGRQSKWTKGVQIYSVSADAHANVQLRIQSQLGVKLDVTKFPPDVIVAPTVTDATATVTDFRLKSISKLDGLITKQLSSSIHKLLVDKLAEDRSKLAQKMNKQIAKHEDKMRLSLSDFASDKWNAFVGRPADQLPDEPATEERLLFSELARPDPVLPQIDNTDLIDLVTPTPIDVSPEALPAIDGPQLLRADGT